MLYRVTAMKFLKEVLKYGLFLVIFTYVTIANRPRFVDYIFAPF